MSRIEDAKTLFEFIKAGKTLKADLEKAESIMKRIERKKYVYPNDIEQLSGIYRRSVGGGDYQARQSVVERLHKKGGIYHG